MYYKPLYQGANKYSELGLAGNHHATIVQQMNYVST